VNVVGISGPAFLNDAPMQLWEPGSLLPTGSSSGALRAEGVSVFCADLQCEEHMEQFENVPLPPDWERRKGERVRKNEAAFKAHNDRRKAFEQLMAGQDEPVPFVCECGDAGCWDGLQLTIAQFNRAHAAPLRYAVKPLHIMPDYEWVVEQHDSYWIVEKYAPGEAPAEAAARLAESASA
jgi:hypothetical protein